MEKLSTLLFCIVLSVCNGNNVDPMAVQGPGLLRVRSCGGGPRDREQVQCGQWKCMECRLRDRADSPQFDGKDGYERVSSAPVVKVKEAWRSVAL